MSTNLGKGKQMNKVEARKAARERAARLRAERVESIRREREEADRLQRERDDANEEDLTEFFQLDAALDAARQAFEDLAAETARKQNAVIARVSAREKKPSVVAQLVDLPVARVTAMRKAHEQAEKQNAAAPESRDVASIDGSAPAPSGVQTGGVDSVRPDGESSPVVPLGDGIEMNA